MDNTIYYFSGTGNSLFIAECIQDQLDNTELINITDMIGRDTIMVQSPMIGFVFPLYFYGLPRIIERMIEKMDMTGVTYCYIVITAMYPDGIGLAQIEDLLAKKGVAMHAGFYIQMPGNYIVKHPVDSHERKQVIIRNAKKKTDRLINIIKEKKIVKDKESRFFNWVLRSKKSYTGWYDEVYGLDRYFYYTDACSGCGICEKRCPVANITLPDYRPLWNNACEQCLRCLHQCPRSAIEYKRNNRENTVGKKRYQGIMGN